MIHRNNFKDSNLVQRLNIQCPTSTLRLAGYDWCSMWHLYIKSNMFGYFTNTVNWEIFIIWNFHFVLIGSTSLRKYFNTKILQHRSQEERMERVTAMEKFLERNCIHGYHVYKKVWVAMVGESSVCERKPKTLPINTLWLWKTKELS